MIDPSDLRLPPKYLRRLQPEYFDDPDPAEVRVVWQPEVYPMALALARRFGSQRIIDIGCGRGDKLASITDEFDVIGVDHQDNVEIARLRVPRARFFNWNLEDDLSDLGLDPSHSIVICSDVIEHLVNPRTLLQYFSRIKSSFDALVLSTPDRDRARGLDVFGPPANPHHVQEWSLAELSSLLCLSDLSPLVHGWSRNISSQSTRNTQIAVIFGDRCSGQNERSGNPESEPQIEAFVPCFNEIDVISRTVSRLLSQVDAVTVIDNWSNDGTWEMINDVFGDNSRIRLQRFPESPSDIYEWERILRHIDSLAAESDADWILRVDSDESVDSFSPNLSLRSSFQLANKLGFDAFDFTLADFRPTTKSATLESLTKFEFSRRSGATALQRAWKNRHALTGMAETGGHALQDGRRLFPLNMTLRHYPIRNFEQGRKKIFEDRKPRFGYERGQRGWHTQYDTFGLDDDFCWPEADLIDWNWRSPLEFMPELTTRAGLSFGSPR